MFSGIIDQIGDVASVQETVGGRCLEISAPGYWSGVDAGASIAIDGVCLTVTAIRGDAATFDVVAETLRRSTLGGVRTGGRVNLQKSLKAGDPIDGHFVQGHVDAVAKINRVEASPQESKWWFGLPPEVMRFIIPKGSVAIDGISLTIADRQADSFSVALIPTTLERTTIGSKRSGDSVNIETDILTRTIVQQLQFMSESQSDVASDLIKRAGKT